MQNSLLFCFVYLTIWHEILPCSSTHYTQDQAPKTLKSNYMVFIQNDLKYPLMMKICFETCWNFIVLMSFWICKWLIVCILYWELILLIIMLGMGNKKIAWEADLTSNLVTTIRLAIVLWFNCSGDLLCFYINTWNHHMSNISHSVTYKMYWM